jgi:hypothetical protein
MDMFVRPPTLRYIGFGFFAGQLWRSASAVVHGRGCGPARKLLCSVPISR